MQSTTSTNVTYDEKTNTVTVEGESKATLPKIRDALQQHDVLQETAQGEWLLRANLVIGRGAELSIAGPDVRWLKLRSDPKGFVWIKALGGTLLFSDTCVTSWDDELSKVDTNHIDGRSFVLARDEGRMDIQRSELSYLGYDANESYGVAWRLEGTRGEIIDSRFIYNFYGLYSYQASDLIIRGNEVAFSMRYGIDPHTQSNRLLIENNVSHHNGKQGIILAEGCNDSIIRNNVTHDNALHGIVMYQGSNNNLIEGNTSYRNGLQGININNSADNIIRNNTVYENTEAGIGVGQEAKRNLVTGNTVNKNGEDGIYLFSDASDNTVEANVVRDNNRYGIYVKSDGNSITTGNEVTGNLIGVYWNIASPLEISRQANRVYNNRETDIQAKAN